jgi:putative ABC transport system permease protein
MIRRAVAAAMSTLREYWGTAALAATTGAVALAAALPVIALAGLRHGLQTRLRVPVPTPVDAGFLWLRAALGPADIRQAAVDLLYRLLFGVAAGVLVMAILTLLAVFVARASARSPEIAVRRAVGATTRHLLGAQLVEGLVVCAAALMIGGTAALALGRLLGDAWPGTLGAVAGGASAGVVVAVLAAILLGALLPVAIVRRPAKSGGVDPTPLALVVPAAQLGLSLTVLAAASMLRLGAERVAPPGAAASGGGRVYEIGAARLSPPERAAAYAMLLRRLGADEGLALASVSSRGALVGLGKVAVAVTESAFYAVHIVLSADSFQAMRLHLLAGRALTDADGWLAPRVAVVNRALAMRLVGIGGKVLLGYGPDAGHVVVGVVDDVKPPGLGAALEPRFVVYTSVLQHPPGDVELLVRAAPGAALDADVRQAVGTTPGVAAMAKPVTEAAVYGAEAAPLRWFARVFGGEGWAMLALATFGTFAVMWLWVASLAGELGLRRAAGARRRDIMRYVLARAAGVAASGVAFGAWVGLMVWDALHRLSATLPVWDPGAVAWSGLLLAVAALAGAAIPAWRAAHRPPAALLQEGQG